MGLSTSGSARSHRHMISAMPKLSPTVRLGRFACPCHDALRDSQSLLQNFTVQVIEEGQEPKRFFWASFGDQDITAYAKVSALTQA